MRAQKQTPLPSLNTGISSGNWGFVGHHKNRRFELGGQGVTAGYPRIKLISTKTYPWVRKWARVKFYGKSIPKLDLSNTPLTQ